ncbi:MAG: hypothetical protein WEA10_10105 [Actinomycetota bacterium]
MEDFERALLDLGFRRSDERRTGRAFGDLYVGTPNRFTTYTVQLTDDDRALFSWEFAIADYVATLGMQVGSDEGLNQYLYPREDLRGPQDVSWLTAALDHTEAMLASVRLAQVADPNARNE